MANGSLKVYAEFLRVAKELNVELCIELNDESKGTLVSKSGCQGFCQMGPLVSVIKGDDDILYTKVKVEDVKEIIEKSIIKDEVVERLCYKINDKFYKGHAEIPFYAKQRRYVLKNCGFIGAEDIEEYISKGGYSSELFSED